MTKAEHIMEKIALRKGTPKNPISHAIMFKARKVWKNRADIAEGVKNTLTSPVAKGVAAGAVVGGTAAAAIMRNKKTGQE